MLNDLELARQEAKVFKSLLDRICDITGDSKHTNENVVLGVERLKAERDYARRRLFGVYQEAGGCLEFAAFQQRENILRLNEPSRFA